MGGPRAAVLHRLEADRILPKPQALLVTGLAGACGPDLRTGDVIVGHPVAAPSAALDDDSGDPALRRRAVRALESARLRYQVGRLLTVDEVATTPAAKAKWSQARGALAVDMESAHVLAWARRAGLPAVAVRAIMDGLEDEVPHDLLRAVGPDGRMRAWAAAGFLGRPALLPAAWRLGRRSHRALGSLARFIRAFVAESGEP